MFTSHISSKDHPLMHSDNAASVLLKCKTSDVLIINIDDMQIMIFSANIDHDSGTTILELFNEHNRDLPKRNVKRMVKSIVRFGGLKFTGQTIIVADDGHLLDGQTRIAAVIDSNIPGPVIVVAGIPRENGDCIDHGGTQRSLPNLFQMKHHDNYARKAEAIKFAINFDNGTLKTKSKLYNDQDIYDMAIHDSKYTHITKLIDEAFVLKWDKKINNFLSVPYWVTLIWWTELHKHGEALKHLVRELANTSGNLDLIDDTWVKRFVEFSTVELDKRAQETLKASGSKLGTPVKNRMKIAALAVVIEGIHERTIGKRKRVLCPSKFNEKVTKLLQTPDGKARPDSHILKALREGGTL